MNGRIEIESTEGVGSKFTVFLNEVETLDIDDSSGQLPVLDYNKVKFKFL